MTARKTQSARFTQPSDGSQDEYRSQQVATRRRPITSLSNMKAISPVRSFRKSSASLSEHSLGISRSKTPVDDPLSLLYNMNDCYSKLKELVPSIPQDKSVSKMEILQHVIDYILDLQLALDSHPAISSLHHQRQGQKTSSRTPLTTLNTDIGILSLQSADFPTERSTDDSKTLYR
ncbi:DNA-binding protein inhibitor ID-2-like [Scleropages formosus]|uniref:DNA-binding protein inhibitor ID-2-like n=1 Tax=Scleropages formosus TaxID=113540 RepID=A0A0P7WMZ6_SCLFO|nr:DNA-binding protein inhibitor ID-2-like [Scleropages formosus]